MNHLHRAGRAITSIGVAALTFIGLSAGPAGAITFGEPDGGAHPYVGSVVGTVEVEPGVFESYQWCTGTLVGPTVFVTASHCYDGYTDTVDFTVTFAEVIDADADGLVDGGVVLHAGVPHIHPRYGSGGANNTYDVAVFELDEPLPGPYAELPAAGLLDGRDAKRATYTTVGYGTVRDDKTRGQHALELGTQRLQTTQTVNSVTKSWITFSMNPSTGDGGTCYGDSGGPHLYGDTDIVVSVTVTGDAWCRATDKTYRLDTADALDFIGDFTG
jgi:secreted trypsin-like serine protease